MRTEEFLIRAEITNTEGLQITRDLLQSLGFAVEGSSTSAPKTKASVTPEVEAKPATEAEKKMIRMLTDAFGSFKATSQESSGINDDGTINVSRSYAFGNKTLELFIEGIATKEGAPFYKKMTNEKVTYYQNLSGTDVRVIKKNFKEPCCITQRIILQRFNW